MRDDEYIKRNRHKFSCTLCRQPPQKARLIRKKRAYKARLLRRKLSEANDTAMAMSWEVPSVDELLNSDLARFVYFAATDCGFDGSLESMTINWLHPLMLAAKAKGSDVDNPDWWTAMNGEFSQEY